MSTTEVTYTNPFQSGLVPVNSEAVRSAMQKAAELAQSGAFLEKHFLSTAYATYAVATSFFNTISYLVTALCHFVMHLTSFQCAKAIKELGNDLHDATMSFALAALGIFYVAAGLLFPKAVFSYFCPATVEEKKSMVDQLQSSLEVLKKQLEESTEATALKEQDVQVLLEQRKQIELQLIDLKKQIHETHLKFNAGKEQAENRFEHDRKALEKAKGEIDHLRTGMHLILQSQKEEAKKYQEQVVQQKTAIDGLMQKVNSLSSVQIKVDDLQKQKEQFEKTHFEDQKKLQAAEEALNQLKTGTANKYETDKKQFEEQVAQQKKAIENLTQKVNSLTSQTSQIQTKANELQKQKEELENTLKQKETEIKEKNEQNEVAQLSRNYQRFQQKETIDELTKKIDSLTSQTSQVQTKADELQKQKEQLEKNCNRLENIIKQTETGAKQNQQEKQVELDLLNKNYQALQTNLQKLTEELKAKNKQSQVDQGQLKMLSEQIEAMKILSESLQTKLKKTEETVESQQMEIVSLRTREKETSPDVSTDFNRESSILFRSFEEIKSNSTPLETFLTTYAPTYSIDDVQAYAKKGEEIKKRILDGTADTIPVNESKQYVLPLYWHMLVHAIEKGDGFENGMICCKDPDMRFIKFLLSVGKEEGVYSRDSSHFKADILPSEFMGKTEKTTYGFDVDSSFETIGLPGSKRTVHFAPIKRNGETWIFLKPENWGTKTLLDKMIHGGDWAWTRKNHYVPAVFGQINGLDDRKEHVPEEDKRAFQVLLTKLEIQCPAAIKDIASMIFYLQEFSMTNSLDKEKVNAILQFIEELETKYDHIPIRNGKEVVLNDSFLGPEFATSSVDQDYEFWKKLLKLKVATSEVQVTSLFNEIKLMGQKSPIILKNFVENNRLKFKTKDRLFHQVDRDIGGMLNSKKQQVVQMKIGNLDVQPGNGIDAEILFKELIKSPAFKKFSDPEQTALSIFAVIQQSSRNDMLGHLHNIFIEGAENLLILSQNPEIGEIVASINVQTKENLKVEITQNFVVIMPDKGTKPLAIVQGKMTIEYPNLLPQVQFKWTIL